MSYAITKECQKKFKVIPREMYPILISYIIRNTSAHKIQSVSMLSSEFDKILQSLMEDDVYYSWADSTVILNVKPYYWEPEHK